MVAITINLNPSSGCVQIFHSFSVMKHGTGLVCMTAGETDDSNGDVAHFGTKPLCWLGQELILGNSMSDDSVAVTDFSAFSVQQGCGVYVEMNQPLAPFLGHDVAPLLS